VIGSFLSQWVLLRRRAILLGGLVLPVLLAVASTLATILTAADAPAGRRGPVDGLDLRQLAAPGGAVATTRGSILLFGVVAFAVAASSIAQEWSLGTLRTMLVREPRRTRFLAGRFLALASYAALLGLLTSAVGIALSLVAARGRGVDTSGWSVDETVGGVLTTTGSLVGYAVLGCAVGMALRSPAAAVGAGVAYLLPLENITANLWDEGRRWLPGQLLGSVSTGGDLASSLTRSGALVGVYIFVLVIIAATLFGRRDVAT
jgi:ABC-2 type transport system permease protein